MRKPPHTLGDGPIPMEFRAAMEAIAESLDHILNGPDKKGDDRNVGFVLLTFPFGDKSGRCNYISNGADRTAIVKLFREQIAHFEKQGDIAAVNAKDLPH